MSTFEEVIEKATAFDGDKDHRVMHGVLMQAVDSQGTDILKLASGHATISPSAPPITFANTVRIASCTKLLTTICALQCVERGLIGLDTALDAHLPEPCSQPIVTLDPSGGGAALTYRKRTRALTLRGLLTHAGGLGHDRIHPALAAWRAARGERNNFDARSTDVLRDYAMPLVAEPGDGWAYGGSIDWAGKLVERLNGGVALEDYMRENVFARLGMRDATFLLGRRADVRERLVQTAERGVGEGEGLRVAEEWMPDEPVDCMGGSGLVCSVEDYVKVLGDLLREEPRVLKRETVDLMFAPQLGRASQEALRESMRAFTPLFGGAVPDSVEINHGLGGLLVLDENPETGSKRNTLSWAGHGNLLWFVNREANNGKGVAAFFAAQIMPSGDEQVAKVVKAFSQEVWRRAG